jgi:hypothetical protein
MASEAEIQAATKAIWEIEDPLAMMSEFRPAARAALEAAERVRQAEPRNVLDDYARAEHDLRR